MRGDEPVTRSHWAHVATVTSPALGRFTVYRVTGEGPGFVPGALLAPRGPEDKRRPGGWVEGGLSHGAGPHSL